MSPTTHLVLISWMVSSGIFFWIESTAIQSGAQCSGMPHLGCHTMDLLTTQPWAVLRYVVPVVLVALLGILVMPIFLQRSAPVPETPEPSSLERKP